MEIKKRSSGPQIQKKWDEKLNTQGVKAKKNPEKGGSHIHAGKIKAKSEIKIDHVGGKGLGVFAAQRGGEPASRFLLQLRRRGACRKGFFKTRWRAKTWTLLPKRKLGGLLSQQGKIKKAV